MRHSFDFFLCSLGVSNRRKTCKETLHVMTWCVVFFSKNFQLHLNLKPSLNCSLLVLNFWANLSLVVLIKIIVQIIKKACNHYPCVVVCHPQLVCTTGRTLRSGKNF